VPLWSVAELNPSAARTSLTEGQRVIIPRHLVPMTTPAVATSAVSSYAAPAGH
jgi:hypothetical protein